MTSRGVMTSLHVQCRTVPLLATLVVVVIYGFIFLSNDPVSAKPVRLAWRIQQDDYSPGVTGFEKKDSSYHDKGSERSQITSEDPLGHVTKKENLLFLKTHKCGTSSIVNLYYLFGLRRRSNFVMHRGSANHYLDLAAVQRRPLLAPRPGEHYNIQCQHGTFYPNEEHKIMPKETTLYATIIRSTVSHFKSAFSFFGGESSMRKRLGASASMDDLIRRYLEDLPDPAKGGLPINMFVNNIAADLGFKRFSNRMGQVSLDEKIAAFISHLDQEMDLVMITDRMDESLVLLKEHLGWKLSDIVYLKRMVSKKPKVEIAEDVQALIKRYNVIDDRIFEHFSAKFDQHIETLGREYVAEQLKEFQETRERFEDKCFDKDKVVKLPYNSVSWAISDWGKKDNLACTFLQARDVILTKVMAEIQSSQDYTIPNSGKQFTMKETVDKIRRDFDEGVDPV